MKCNKCKCNSCICNVNCMYLKHKEFKNKKAIDCFNCEECRYYENNIFKNINKKEECIFYIRSEHNKDIEVLRIKEQANKRRKQFKII